MGKLWRRLSAFIHRKRLERELEEDMAAHRERMGADAPRRFGSDLRLREQAADAWGWTWLDQLRQDLAYGLRSLARSPGFALTAVAVLALGIGVNLAEIHLFDALFHRIHVRDVDSLRQFYRIRKEGVASQFSLPAIDFYTRNNTVLSAVLTETPIMGLFAGDNQPDLRCTAVSGNFFSELGIAPVYGRLLDAHDQAPDAPPAAVLGYGYWQNHFGGDPAAVLRVVRLNGKPVRIVGIAPAEFGGLARPTTEMWVPQSQYPYLTGDSNAASGPSMDRTTLVGRLRPGVSDGAVEAQFRSLTAALRNQQPESVGRGEWLKPRDVGSKPAPDPKAILLVGTFVLLVLLILASSCANLGNMLLARGLSRQREIDIRLSIGAGRGRLVRQLMTENLVLAVASSAAALLVGKLAALLLLRIINAPPDLRIATDWRIVLSCAGLGFAAMLGFGLAPAFQTVRKGRAATGTRKVLVAIQVAVSCVLLILSGFFLRAVERTYRSDVAFDLSGMAVVYPEFYLHNYSAAEAQQAAQEIADRLRHVPGIDTVSIAAIPPVSRRAWIEHASGQQLYLNAVDAAYFPMMRLALLTGRIFEPGDRNAAVLSQSAARRLWPNESPLGKTLFAGGRDRIVTGVVADSGANQLSFPESVEAYTPIDAPRAPYLTLLVHTAANPSKISGALREAAARPGLTPRVSTFQAEIADRVDAVQKTVAVVASLGGIATWLAMIGIFGLLAFSVAQRTREIGVRMALGARTGDVLRCIVGQYAVAFAAGAAAGIAVATIAIAIVRKILYGFMPFDPLSYAGGLAVFAAVALIAAIAPARRALKIDAAAALRWE